ncbi:MAG: hypothetical protein WC313_10845 [Candidatus Kapaibacterium sp.]
MNLFKITIIIILYTFTNSPILFSEQLEAKVGEIIELKVLLPVYDDDADFLSGMISVQNTSLIYPFEIRIGEHGISNFTIQKIDESNYSFNILLNDLIESDTLLVKCEVLAGNDSTCLVILSNIRIDDMDVNGTEYNIKIKSQFGELPYFRYPEIISVYPVPVSIGNELFVEYFHDFTGSVEIYLIDILGRYEFVKLIDVDVKGTQKTKIPINTLLPVGVYGIEIRTKFGKSSKLFILSE